VKMKMEERKEEEQKNRKNARRRKKDIITKICQIDNVYNM
jgi:hypothetical protein